MIVFFGAAREPLRLLLMAQHVSKADWSDLLPVSINRRAAETIFRQLYNELRRLILSGAAASGSRLPATQVNRRQAGRVPHVGSERVPAGFRGRGLCRKPHRGRDLCRARDAGTAARARGFGRRPPATPPARPTPAIRYARLKPDYTQFEILPFNLGRCTVDDRTLTIWRRLTAAQLRKMDPTWLGYADPRGSLRLRMALAQYLRAARGVQCDPAQIVVLSGVQQAIDLVLRILVEPG